MLAVNSSLIALGLLSSTKQFTGAETALPAKSAQARPPSATRAALLPVGHYFALPALRVLCCDAAKDAQGELAA